jgi:phosphoribosylglycinamide formyltransferase-1
LTIPSRLVVLISGNGSNLQAILDACKSGELNANVVSVISNKADAYGFVRAKNASVEAIHFPKLENESRNEYDARLAELVNTKQPEYVVLAGWMRILTASFLSHFPSRVVNLHPALPNTFPGTHAIERAFEAYGRGEIEHTGIMVHLVPDEGVDNGPVLATEIVPISKEDTLESLEVRIHETEHKLLVATLKELLNFGLATPNLTLDTSCIVPLLHLPDDFTDQNEIHALEKIQKAHVENKLAIWVSKKSVNESLMNLQNPKADQTRYEKWLDTLQLLDDYNKTASALVLDISRLDYDAVLVSDEQADAFMKIEQVIKGNKSKLDIGDVYDISILYEHYLQGNDLFVALDAKIFRKTVMQRLNEKFGIRVVTPLNAMSILESEYKIVFN